MMTTGYYYIICLLILLIDSASGVRRPKLKQSQSNPSVRNRLPKGYYNEDNITQRTIANIEKSRTTIIADRLWMNYMEALTLLTQIAHIFLDSLIDPGSWEEDACEALKEDADTFNKLTAFVKAQKENDGLLAKVLNQMNLLISKYHLNEPKCERELYQLRLLLEIALKIDTDKKFKIPLENRLLTDSLATTDYTNRILPIIGGVKKWLSKNSKAINKRIKQFIKEKVKIKITGLPKVALENATENIIEKENKQKRKDATAKKALKAQEEIQQLKKKQNYRYFYSRRRHNGQKNAGMGKAQSDESLTNLEVAQSLIQMGNSEAINGEMSNDLLIPMEPEILNDGSEEKDAVMHEVEAQTDKSRLDVGEIEAQNHHGKAEIINAEASEAAKNLVSLANGPEKQTDAF